jgi:hypothetical protein
LIDANRQNASAKAAKRRHEFRRGTHERAHHELICGMNML